MILFFHGLHIPEILPGLEEPLPGPDGIVELPLYPTRAATKTTENENGPKTYGGSSISAS